MAAAALGRRGLLERTAPFETFVFVVGFVVVERDVDLDHAGLSFEAEFCGCGARRFVAMVGVLEDEESATEREGWVEEDGVGGGNGIVVHVG